MTRYHVEYYSKETGDMICWYSAGCKTEAERQVQRNHKDLTVTMKEVHHA